METLTPDIISHIGTFLDSSDRGSCGIASKLFMSISASYEHHEIFCTQNNYVDKLIGFDGHIEHLLKIKPKLRTVKLTFYEISAFIFKGCIATDIADTNGVNIDVRVVSCFDASTIIERLPRRVRHAEFDFHRYSVGPIRDLPGSTLSLTLRNRTQLATLTDKTVMENCACITIDLDEDVMEVIDLENVKPTAFVALFVPSLNVHVHQPHKIHTFSLRNRGDIFPYRGFYDSLVADKNMTQSKMRYVVLWTVYPLLAWQEDHMLYKITKLLPADAEYYVSPCYHPNSLLFLQKCCAKHVRLLCTSHDEYVQCRIVQLIDRPYEITHLAYMPDYANETYETLADAFDALSPDLQSVWFWVRYLASRRVTDVSPVV